MALITNNPNIKSQFINCWVLDYVPAVIKYAKKSKKKSVLNILDKMKDDDHQGGQSICFFNSCN